MGLLDDAIREHLECKRLHGADLDEVARQEHEALGPVYRGESASDVDPRSGGDPRALDSGETTSTSVAAPAARAVGGQETAEIDMRTVLEAGLPPGSGQPATSSPRQREASPGDSLEWEVPGKPQGVERSREQHRVELAGEREDGDGEVSDDVLEETPDFLRGTPDQERLWFEQQPPRDFDFDK